MRAMLMQMDLDDALLDFERIPDVLKEKTTTALWLKLKQLCMTKSPTSKLTLKHKLYSHHKAEGGSLQYHLTMFKEIVADLEILEVKYDEEDLVLIPLCSLPSSFSSFRDTILYSRDTLTIEEVYDAMFSKEKMELLVGDLTSKGGDALVTYGDRQRVDQM
ncbi:uncharacterized protein LOC111391918 [Olea europaea var. sylvestris]|uniref:uncharacterized protein LOC111391918 n=1 Tax=Olea europaea var. sylvestris TaxID=158386 RepID=UPI000C1D3BC0|nr:uncharacterized protein LOC111391918 [Olea europaea var. sylvestris]